MYETPLPPTDGGAAAWLFLLGTWLVEAFCYGFVLVFGIFQSYYMQHPEFQHSSKSIPAIGTSAIGVSYLGMPVATVIALRYARYRRHMACLGWLFCLLSLVAASFASHVWQLILTQGILYGAGFVACYTPILMLLNEWWVQRRGLAYGVIFGAGGVSGATLPFILDFLLKKYGFGVTLQLYAAAILCISGPALLLIRPRGQDLGRPADSKARLGFFTKKLFYVHAICILLQGLGFFVPPVFLPSFADSLRLGSEKGALLLTFGSIAQVIGQLAVGWASDKVDVHILLSASSLVSGLATVLIWGPSKTFFPLMLFSIIYGFFAGSYSVIWSRLCHNLTSNPREEMILYSFFSFERGVGNILSGPIAGVLLGAEESIHEYALGRYQKIVWFTGITILISSLSGLGYFWKGETWGRREEVVGSNMLSEDNANTKASGREHGSFELEPLQKAFLSEDSD